MKLNRIHQYKMLDRVTNNDGTRFYTEPDTGNPLPSVTTVIDKTSDKAFLVEWEARVGKKKADKEKLYATTLGTLVHTHIENYILGTERPRGNVPVRVLANTMSQRIIDEGLKNVTEVWGLEVPLYYPGLYAGTTDLVGLYKGRQAIVDYKSAKHTRSKEIIGNYFDQISAYAIAHDEVYGTNIECCVIFMVNRNNEFTEYMIENDELIHHKNSFLDRLNNYIESI